MVPEKCSVGFLALVLALVLGLSSAYDLENLPTHKLTDEEAQNLFADYVVKYNKRFEMDQVDFRLKTFRENVDWMIKFNSDPENTSTVGINQFADWRREEWSQVLGLRTPDDFPSPEKMNEIYDFYDELSDEDNPEFQEIAHLPQVENQASKWDWTVEEKDASGKILHPKATLPIRNQQSCGSCYSFSAMAAAEGLYRINYWDKVDKWEHFSVQQGVDCTGPRYGCSGCSGGFMTGVFAMLRDTGGVCWEKDYPYQNKAGTCRASQCKRAFSFRSYRDITGQSESTLIKHLAVNPLSIGITSAVPEIMYYKSGILTTCGNKQQPDHGVNAVGYDTTGSIPWFKVRNSWGPDWGEAGHMRVALGGNLCKWRSMVSYPVL